MSDRLKACRAFREQMNARFHESGNLEIKRLFALDSRDELFEAFNVALVVGGSITIPHLRRAVATLDEVEAMA
ncbi:MAG: hypothetical protein IT180_07210 [Acidobacteria bacterium]|nr:hypothetical protein [Acidobacteriota bacterium]